MGGPMPPMNDQMRKLARAFQENSPDKHELTKGLTAAQVYRAISPFALLDDLGSSVAPVRFVD
jgi:hypothetical protein